MKFLTNLFAAILLLNGAALTAAAQPKQEGLKYVFYFIGDGMGNGHAVSSEMYRRAIGGDPATPWLMMRFPVNSQVLTYSANSPVTDSAAAGTALATGTKTRNNMVGMDPDTVAVASLARDFKQRGLGVGIVSSNGPDDATPASFYANVEARNMYYDIAMQFPRTGIDFLGGANLRAWNEHGDRIRQVYGDAGISISFGLDELMRSQGKRKVLLNQNRSLNNTLGYAIDSIPNTLTLPELTAACLDHLEAVSPEGFLMVVENGLTDWSAHANDAGTLMREVERLNEAIAVAYRFLEERPQETLIIVTADHDTGGATVGNAYPDVKYNAHLELLALQRISKDAFSQEVKEFMTGANPSWKGMEALLERDLGYGRGVNPTPEETKRLRELFDNMLKGKSEKEQKTLYASFDAFTAEVFRIRDSHAGFGWISTYHTGNPVPLYAVGYQANRFSRLTDNSQITPTIRTMIENSFGSIGQKRLTRKVVNPASQH